MRNCFFAPPGNHRRARWRGILASFREKWEVFLQIRSGDNRITAEVINAFSRSDADLRRGKAVVSDRGEKAIVQLVTQGLRNKEIGVRLFISEQTVKNHLHNIFDKLGVSDRLELALHAIHHQLMDQR